MIVCSVVLCVCCRSVLVDGLSLVLLYSEDDMVVMSGDVGCLALWSGYLC